MRNKSHALMGRILLCEYLPSLPKTSAKAFLLGCTQPDKNPATYIKGSLRSCWLRGHNYSNASRYMMRLAHLLDGKTHLSTWDCYCLGKLIHYTLDAFTFAHDQRFPKDLKAHRRYERQRAARFRLAFGSKILSPIHVERLSTAHQSSLP